MTDKKTKKEKPSYDIEILRRATVDDKYNFYELKAIIDPAKIDGVTAIRDIEKIVTFARELIATEEPEKRTGTIFKIPPEVRESTAKRTASEPTEDIKIADLRDGDKKINIKVRFLKIGSIKTFTKSDGTEGKLSKINVENESGKILLTAWDDQAVQAQEIKKNAWVSLQAAYVTEYKGTLELNVGNWSKMEVVYNG